MTHACRRRAVLIDSYQINIRGYLHLTLFAPHAHGPCMIQLVLIAVIIIMEICKAPTLQLKVLNKHRHNNVH